MSEADADAILKAGTAVDTKEKNTVEIMTAAKATPLLRKLESRSGMETLGEPEATTTSLRQIQMHSGNSTVDMNPALLADGYTMLFDSHRQRAGNAVRAGKCLGQSDLDSRVKQSRRRQNAAAGFHHRHGS